jgi:hypothetical protein
MVKTSLIIKGGSCPESALRLIRDTIEKYLPNAKVTLTNASLDIPIKPARGRPKGSKNLLNKDSSNTPELANIKEIWNKVSQKSKEECMDDALTFLSGV